MPSAHEEGTREENTMAAGRLRNGLDKPIRRANACNEGTSARARECPRVTAVYRLGKQTAQFARVSVKPSDGLERRPPPYHRATMRDARARPGSRGHERRAKGRNRPKTSDRACPAVPGLVFPQCSLAAARWSPGLATPEEMAGERQCGWSSTSSPGSVVLTVRQESQVILRMTKVMARPTIGSARG
jgi:hypothetical protein